jgi:hypothetical protein
MKEKTLFLTNGQEKDIAFAIEETDEFQQLNSICQKADFYTSANPSRANIRRSQLIDIMAKKNGLEPRMFELSQEQQLAVGNQLAALLANRLKSPEKIGEIMNGKIAVKELFIGEDPSELIKFSDEIQTLLSGDPKIKNLYNENVIEALSNAS